MKKKLVIFDMDGTILYTLEDLAGSLNHTLTKCGYKEHTTEEVRSYVGNGIRKLVERALPETTEEQEISRVFAEFNIYYKEHCAEKTRPYEGIVDVIEKLRANGVKTAVVSNKADYGVQALCKKYFDGLFDYAVGERKGIRRKPEPDSVYEVLEKLGCKKEEAVYVGDSEVDFNTALNAGMDLIMVSWGFRDKQSLIDAGAKLIIDKPEQITENI